MENKSPQLDAQSDTQHGIHKAMTIEGEGAVKDNQHSGFRFGRMFPATHQHPVILKESTFIALGRHMTSKSHADRGDSNLPAGYTYFGQFVDHDITADKTKGPNNSSGSVADLDLIQERSPSLDLDSLYGGPNAKDEALFEISSAKFKIGMTSPAGGKTQVTGAIKYDLPRKSEAREPKHGAPKKTALPALIGDGRNDENLAVAQTHLMWLKFHNHVVDKITKQNSSLSPDKVCADARELVTRHYQYIVLHDFVKRFIQPEVYESVIVKGNRNHLDHGPGETAFMPLEFSVAAYRHGHTQVREEYDWNINFNNRADAMADSKFQRLFEFSEVSGNFGGFGNTLPTNWIVNFRHLYDFGDRNFPNLEGAVLGVDNFAKAIDPFLASALGNLPELLPAVQAGVLPTNDLAALNLRRGSMRLLPSAQDLSREMKNVKMLTKTEMKSVLDEPFAATLETLEMYERTPLWLYILIEAAVHGDGNALGHLGSTIVAETFQTLVLTSKTSILRGPQKWSPEDSVDILEAAEPLETIPALLFWMDNLEAIIDPLQDKRLMAMA